MKRGLVLGKFAPLHRGHQSLIERSLAECDETIVLVYAAKETTSVPLPVRAGWIRALYPAATVIEGVDAPAATGRDPVIMHLQEDYIGRVVPHPITHFFCSEWYGTHVSAFLGAADVRVDEARARIPISGSMIRANPEKYRHYLDPLVYADQIKWDMPTGTRTLFRPVGPKELKLIKDSGWRAYPPRLPEQPIFYPVTNEGYAIQIARDWNVKASDAGFVTRFEVDAAYVSRFPKRIVGSREHEELWVPAEELSEFNSKIVGKIEVIHSFSKEIG